MHFKVIACQVFTRELEQILERTAHTVDLDLIPMGQHALGAEMRPHLQERIDAADPLGYDAILLGYALCGCGTEGLIVSASSWETAADSRPTSKTTLGSITGRPVGSNFRLPTLSCSPPTLRRRTSWASKAHSPNSLPSMAKTTAASSMSNSLSIVAATLDLLTSPLASPLTMRAAPRRVPKPQRKAGPSMRSRARSRCSIVLSAGNGKQPTFLLFPPALRSAQRLTKTSWNPYECRSRYN
jgi:hypothetical protein